MCCKCKRCWRARDVQVRLWGQRGVWSLKEMAACPQAAEKAEHKWKRTADDNTVSNAKIIHIRLLPVRKIHKACFTLSCSTQNSPLVKWCELPQFWLVLKTIMQWTKNKIKYKKNVKSCWLFHWSTLSKPENLANSTSACPRNAWLCCFYFFFQTVMTILLLHLYQLG